jgi:hypothetical protein
VLVWFAVGMVGEKGEGKGYLDYASAEFAGEEHHAELEGRGR